VLIIIPSHRDKNNNYDTMSESYVQYSCTRELQNMYTLNHLSLCVCVCSCVHMNYENFKSDGIKYVIHSIFSDVHYLWLLPKALTHSTFLRFHICSYGQFDSWSRFVRVWKPKWTDQIRWSQIGNRNLVSTPRNRRGRRKRITLLFIVISIRHTIPCAYD
jgi:hypothetical protein